MNQEIINGQLLIKASEEKMTLNQSEPINIKIEKGKVYLGNRTNNKVIQIPIEDKIYIEKIYIENNLLNIFGNSPIAF